MSTVLYIGKQYRTPFSPTRTHPTLWAFLDPWNTVMAHDDMPAWLQLSIRSYLTQEAAHNVCKKDMSEKEIETFPNYCTHSLDLLVQLPPL